MASQRSVLITGCSEGGIGDALAQEFLREGLKVFATARNLKSVQQLKELGCEVCRLDVTDEKSVKEAVEFVEIQTKGKGLDVLVNNAGTAYISPVLDTDIIKSRQQFDVNYWGVLTTTQLFFPLLLRAKGTIVNIGSGIIHTPSPYTSPYRSTKVALEALTHSMRMEMEPFGLHVIHATVGFITTRLVENTPTRPITETSMYWPIREQVQKYMSVHEPTMTADVLARRLVPKVLKRNPPPVIYDGGGISMVKFVSAIAGLFGVRTWDWLWGFMSGLPQLRKIVQQREKAKNV